MKHGNAPIHERKPKRSGEAETQKISGIKRELFALENKNSFNKGLIGWVLSRTVREAVSHQFCTSIEGRSYLCIIVRRCIKVGTQCVFRRLSRLLIPPFRSVLPTN